MAVKIRLKRMGKIRVPQYRIVVSDARRARGGRAIEEIGLYHPKEDPSRIVVNADRVAYWLGVGAQPTEPVRAILRVTGDWQRFTGEPGVEGTLRVAPPKPDRRAAYDAAVIEAITLKEKATGDAGGSVKASGARKKAADGGAKGAQASEGGTVSEGAADAASAEAGTSAEVPARDAGA